jgi:hypothetical protein
MAVNGSVTAVEFEWVNDKSTICHVNRLILHYVDTGTFDAAKYGNGVTLTNGIKLELIADDGATVVLDLLDGFPIKTNSEWAAVAYDWKSIDIGTGDDAATVRFTFGNSGDALYVAPGEAVRMTVQDDLTGLTSHTAKIQGWIE